MNNPWSNYFKTVDEFLPGNNMQLKLATCALLVGKHCLIEDIPGKGKTLLAKYLGKNFDLQFKRIQCTNDLMPSDIVGFHQWNHIEATPLLRPGPIFSDLVLVDEVNRASPRTQSALLQAMEEKAVSIDNQTYELSHHFCVLATQNPQEHVGTSSLPESQLDRFLFKFNMGNLSYEQEIQLLQTGSRHEKIKNTVPFFSIEKLIAFKAQILNINLPDTLYQWITLCLQKSRQDQDVNPLSSRSGLDFVLALKSWALINNRNQVQLDDFTELFPYCFAHRLYLAEKDNHEIHIQKSLYWLKNLKL